MNSWKSQSERKGVALSSVPGNHSALQETASARILHIPVTCPFCIRWEQSLVQGKAPRSQDHFRVGCPMFHRTQRGQRYHPFVLLIPSQELPVTFNSPTRRHQRLHFSDTTNNSTAQQFQVVLQSLEPSREPRAALWTRGRMVQRARRMLTTTAPSRW